MSFTLQSACVVVFVKALPQRSATHGETVCCAGVTPQGGFRRLYPVRYRHLADEAAFKRWARVDFRYRRPTRDRRPESCHVMEETITVTGRIPKRDRARFLNPLVSPSVVAAADTGRSLALIRPRNTRFTHRPKPASEIEDKRHAYREAAAQGSLFDEQLAALEPSPYEFRFHFEDGSGPHRYVNADWKAHAMFYHGRQRTGSDEDALSWMSRTFIEDYPRREMLFCVGNVAGRPQTWQLLGVLRVDEPDDQGALDLG